MIEKYMTDNNYIDDRNKDYQDGVERRKEVAKKLFEKIDVNNQRYDEEQAEKLKNVIAETPDKEPFDIEVLKEHYSLRDFDTSKGKEESDYVADRFRKDYYLNNQDVSTIADYAEKLKDIDRNEAN